MPISRQMLGLRASVLEEIRAGWRSKVEVRKAAHQVHAGVIVLRSFLAGVCVVRIDAADEGLAARENIYSVLSSPR